MHFQGLELSCPNIVYTSKALVFSSEHGVHFQGDMAIEHIACPSRFTFRKMRTGDLGANPLVKVGGVGRRQAAEQ